MRGTSAAPSSRAGLRSAVAWPAIAALWKKPVMCARFSRQRLQHRVAVLRQAGELLVLAGEDGEDPVGLAQRRIGAVDRPRRGPGRARRGPPPRSLRISRKRSRVGQPLDVVDQVEVDRLAVVLERQEVLAGAGLAVRDLFEERRRLACRAPAAGSACSRRTSRRSATAGGSGSWRPAEVLEARVGDVHHDDRLAGHRVRCRPRRLAISSGVRDVDRLRPCRRWRRRPGPARPGPRRSRCRRSPRTT